MVEKLKIKAIYDDFISNTKLTEEQKRILDMYINKETTVKIAMDITWKEAYKELCKSAMEQGQMMDNAIFVRNFLDKKFKRIPYEETYIGEFAENHPIGKYLITTNNHITACVNGYIIDTWNCSNKKIEYVWKIL